MTRRQARRKFVPAIVFPLVAWASVGLAQTQPYPAKAVRIINNSTPGGPSDVVARAFGQILQEQFKQPFVIENLGGAGGNIGAEAVARSAADGYTLLATIDTPLTVNPHIYGKSMAFKPSDLKPVMILASSGLMVAVNVTTGIQSMKDLIAAGVSKGVTLASGGSGNPGHLAAEMFKEATGAKITHVPYKGNAPAVTALMGNEVDGGILATPGFAAALATGRIRALAVTSANRSPLAPTVPTVAEVGYPNLQSEVLYVMMAPAATSDAVVSVLQARLQDGLKRADVQDRLKGLDLRPEGIAGAAAVRRLAETAQRFGRIVQATGMTVE